jgi:hypothetical protein
MSATRHSALALAGALLVALDAGAFPREGTPRPDVTLEDAWGRSVRLSSYDGEPMLVVYEDKDSAGLNAAFKGELSLLGKGDRYRSSVALIAVADVAGYDYWPVRGFVKDAIRDESKKRGVDIFCDWDGHVGEALGLRRGTSNVVLYGKDGKVLFAAHGALTRDARAQVVSLLRNEVEGRARPPSPAP